MLSGLAQAYDYSYDYTTTTTDTGGLAGLAVFTGVWMFIWLAVAVFMIVCMWKMFEKAGEQGWKSIIPIYNYWTLCEIVGKPGWWSLVTLLMAIPIINFVAWIPALIVAVIVSIELAKSFGKEPVWAVLFILLPIVGYPILAFDKNTKYVGPGGKAKSGGASKPAAPAAPAATSK